MYVLKKDNEGMKVQLRTIMQEKMRMQKSIKEYEEDIRELKEEISFYKAKRVDDLNKLLNETYDWSILILYWAKYLILSVIIITKAQNVKNPVEISLPRPSTPLPQSLLSITRWDQINDLKVGSRL